MSDRFARYRLASGTWWLTRSALSILQAARALRLSWLPVGLLTSMAVISAPLDVRAPPPAPPVQLGPVPDTQLPPTDRPTSRALEEQVEWALHKTADGQHPSGEEQTYLWLMNRARQNPSAEGAFLANSGEPDIESAISFFSVDTAMLQNEFDLIPAKPPAAFDRRLYQAAEAHSLDLIARDAQDHNGQFERVVAAGFTYSRLRGNVFSYARNALHGHAGWNIDWGSGTGGMQDPRGHRLAVMSVDGDYANVGIAAISETNSGTRVGPWVVTGNYAEAGTWADDHYNRFLVGTVWQDLDGDGRYDSGEGIANVSVTPDHGPFYAVTAAGGGYAIPIDAGSYSVSFSGGGLSNSVTRDVVVGSNSVLVDLINTPATSTST
ncbi:hypothetical protein U5801_25590, partial [Lamprobacter modestohalophilus]|uniref:hypothetical protein n=1 Tax=Lamprobacter modestohalophilus TaxID=1064514 RepID=UPI002ADEC10F